jgi:hypothetical protein
MSEGITISSGSIAASQRLPNIDSQLGDQVSLSVCPFWVRMVSHVASNDLEHQLRESVHRTAFLGLEARYHALDCKDRAVPVDLQLGDQGRVE